MGTVAGGTMEEATVQGRGGVRGGALGRRESGGREEVAAGSAAASPFHRSSPRHHTFSSPLRRALARAAAPRRPHMPPPEAPAGRRHSNPSPSSAPPGSSAWSPPRLTRRAPHNPTPPLPQCRPMSLCRLPSLLHDPHRLARARRSSLPPSRPCTEAARSLQQEKQCCPEQAGATTSCPGQSSDHDPTSSSSMPPSSSRVSPDELPVSCLRRLHPELTVYTSFPQSPTCTILVPKENTRVTSLPASSPISGERLPLLILPRKHPVLIPATAFSVLPAPTRPPDFLPSKRTASSNSPVVIVVVARLVRSCGPWSKLEAHQRVLKKRFLISCTCCKKPITPWHNRSSTELLIPALYANLEPPCSTLKNVTAYMSSGKIHVVQSNEEYMTEEQDSESSYNEEGLLDSDESDDSDDTSIEETKERGRRKVKASWNLLKNCGSV